MSVSRKVLRRMKKVMWLLGTVPILAACSSQISRADSEVHATFDYFTGTLRFSGDGIIDDSWQKCYNPSSVRRVIIENGIKGIGEYAFCDCKYLEEITIPQSVTSIGERAFMGCKSLKKITIPKYVTSIGERAFVCCTSLREITIPNSVTFIGEGAFWNCVSLREITIPNSVNIICKGTFWGCRFLQKITIPNSVTFIGEDAFYGCKSLREITIPSSVNIICKGAFAECANLETVKFDGIFDENSFCNVAVLEDAFSYCKKLALFATGNRIVYFNINAFFECDKNFRALEDKCVGNKLIIYGSNYYDSDYYRDNYFVPHDFLVDKTKYWGRN